ncbi:WD40 repeat domain-containing protein [Streptomyces sp. NPDC086554]|uniref:WD40 repeat domain-containing protein n=1 Tax=Streptomyces sp. NPDC086554 TaxID=3154864 RepID=UPI0034370297
MGRREKPLEPTAGPVQRFAHELRKLRVDAGSPTYRAMAQRVAYSAPTLSAAAAGERLPTLPVLLAYVSVCDGEPEEWERRWYEAVAESAERDMGDGESPYPGLARFGADDQARFHGRGDLVDELVRLTSRRRVAAVIGASGSGKSSLLRAGLIPALRESTDQWRPAAIRILTPGDRPARTHKHLLTPADGVGDTLLVIDQFEEVFSLCHSTAERTEFLDRLLMARASGSRLRVIVAVRADFYGRCAEHGPLADALGDANLLVGPMSPSRLREAIVRPAAAEQLVVERTLTARIVADVADEPGGLPLMAHALREVWRRRNGKTLTEAAYEAIGGVRGAIAHTAEEVFGRLTDAEAATARRLLLRMVAPGDGTQDTRRPVDRAELPPGCDDVLERLVAARLLTVDGTTVDLAHEALIGAWPRLRGWVDADRDRLRLHRALTEAAVTWQELGRDAGAVYRGTRLTAAREAFGSGASDSSDSPELAALELTDLERDFLRAGVDAHDHDLRAKARAARRTRALVSGLAVLLCLAVVAGVAAWQQNRNGERQRAEAQARRIVGVAQTLRRSDPVTAMRLSVAAWRVADLPETREAVRAAGAWREQDSFAALDDSTAPNAPRWLSADGRTLTAIDRDRVMRWDVRGHRRISTTSRPGIHENIMAVSADGRMVAQQGRSGVLVWDLVRNRAAGPRLGTGDRWDMDGWFGPSGRTFVIRTRVGDRATVQVWDIRRHKLLDEIRGRDTESPAPALSPDDRLLATCSVGGRLSVRDVAKGRYVPRTWPRDVDEQVCGAPELTFTPDSRALSFSMGSGIRTWEPTTGRERPKIKLPAGSEGSVAFDDDGTVAAVQADGDITLRKTDSPGTPLLRYSVRDRGATELRVDTAAGVIRYRASSEVVRTLDIRAALTVHRRGRPLTAARFSPDGRTLATVEGRGAEGKFRVRDARSGAVSESLPGPACADCGTDQPWAFSPDSRALAYGSVGESGTTVRRWNIRGAEESSRTRVPSLVESLAVPSRGTRVVAAGRPPGERDNDEWHFEVWNMTGDTLTKALRQRTGGLLGTLAPDGRSLLTSDGVLTDLETGRSSRALRGEDMLSTMVHSPDGRLLAVADDIGRITLWDARGRRVLGVLSPGSYEWGTGEDPFGSVLSFSEDGRYLAAGGPDGTVRVWETDTPRLAGAEYPSTDGPVLALGFTGDELRVATAHIPSRSVPIGAGSAADAVCERARGGLSRGQWRTYLPTVEYRKTC